MKPGARLSHYRIERELARGGMGEVYAAVDETLGRRVAVKVLPRRLAARADRRACFDREARAASALRHPNIVSVYDVSELDGIHFIVMELLDGETLADRLTRGSLATPDTLSIAIPITDALARAHDRGIVHRDVKPGNIMSSKDGDVKILDFGLAKLFGPDDSVVRPIRLEPVTSGGGALGTPSYMSPEQALGHSGDARSDIFSFGAVLYEMLAGRQAFTGHDAAAVMGAVLRNEPPPLEELVPRVPPELVKVVERALQTEPSHRWSSMAELNARLRDVRDALSTTADSDSMTWPRVAAFAGLVAAALGAREWLSKKE